MMMASSKSFAFATEGMPTADLARGVLLRWRTERPTGPATRLEVFNALIMPDQAARLAALRSGKVDVLGPRRPSATGIRTASQDVEAGTEPLRRVLGVP